MKLLDLKDKIIINRSALKQRGSGYVFYNYEWFKKHFVMESKLVMGEPYVPMSAIERIKAEIDKEIKDLKEVSNLTIATKTYMSALVRCRDLIDQAIKECDT